MLWELLLKDLKRARHNPWPFIINLALPLCITALIGLAFGPSSKGGSMGQIKLAIVDQDDSVLSKFIRAALDQGEAKKYLVVTFLERAEALKQINANQISAVLVIPKGFTQSYLKGDQSVAFDLIKNPAQSFYPAIVEELTQVLVTALNGLSRNLHADLPEWMKIIEKEGKPDMQAIAKLMFRVGDKLDKAEKYLFPPLVSYSKETHAKEKESGPAQNIFGYLLPGLAAMFLLFLADNSIRDLYEEMRMQTFARFRTVRHRLLPFIVSKVILAVAILLIGGAILFLGGGLIFGIHWNHPLLTFLLIFAFALWASGFMAFLAALARSERRASVINGAVILGLSFVGGSLFPTRQLPAFLRDHVSPLMPNNWFIESIRGLQSGGDISWMWSAMKLTLVGLLLVIIAAAIFQRMLSKGTRV